MAIAPTQVRTASVDDPPNPEPINDPVETPAEDEGGLPAAREPAAPGPDDQGDEVTVSELRAKPSLNDIERDAIGERYAAKRRAELGLEAETPPADGAVAATDAQPNKDSTARTPADGGDGASAVPASPAAPRITDQPTPGRHKLKVNGQELEVGYDELVRIAQEGLATGVTLEEAKRLRNEARAEAGLPRQADPGEHHAGNQPDRGRTTDQPHDPARSKKVDPAQLIPVVRQLQVGTEEEAAQALAEILDRSEDRTDQPQPADVSAEVEQALSRRDATREAEQALRTFSTKYPELAKDNDFSNMVVARTAQEIISDFERIGVPQDDIAAARRNPSLLIEGYRQLRNAKNPATGQPWGLRSYDQILDAAGQAVAKKVGLKVAVEPGAEPGKVVVNGNRAAAKANLTQQPRSAGLPPAGRLNGADTSQPPPRARGSDIVAEQRRARGFSA